MSRSLPLLALTTETPHGPDKLNNVLYVAVYGYFATPVVYDVVVTANERSVAVVGFIDGKQTKGALFWQVRYMEYRRYDEEAVLEVARAYARNVTGWALEWP